jgi:hypothetical protein
MSKALSCAIRKAASARLASALRRNLWVLCVVALLAGNASLIWRNRQMSEELGRVYQPINDSGLRSLMMTSLPVAQGGAAMLEMSCGRYLALFIFARYDGPFYRDDAVSLDGIGSRRPGVHVFGLMAYATPSEALRLARREGITYPVLADTTGRILRGLNLPRTPWEIVFDCSRRRLVYQDAPALTGAERRTFARRLLSLPRN